MDAKTCIQKLQYVGVLAFATVDRQGNPQIRNISAIHYEPDALYDLTLAPEADGVLLLPDSIEVEIDAATGEICSYNAHNYIMYHGQRASMTADVDMETAKSAVVFARCSLFSPRSSSTASSSSLRYMS